MADTGLDTASGMQPLARRRRIRTGAVLLLCLAFLLAVPSGYSRIARGTWDCFAPAERIDLPNGRRYYPGDLVPAASAPDLRGFMSVGIPWPDHVYVESGPTPDVVWAQGPDGGWREYVLSGSW